jgi:hypothetical protein
MDDELESTPDGAPSFAGVWAVLLVALAASAVLLLVPMP